MDLVIMHLKWWARLPEDQRQHMNSSILLCPPLSWAMHTKFYAIIIYSTHKKQNTIGAKSFSPLRILEISIDVIDDNYSELLAFFS